MTKRKPTQGSKYIDPVTGDELTRLEYLVRQAQVVVRTPWFIVAFNVTTVLILLGHGDLWNYFASWLAIIVEWLVGTYMFGQTGRDATIIRKNTKLEEQNQHLLERVEQMEERILLAVSPPAVHYSEESSEQDGDGDAASDSLSQSFIGEAE